MAYFVAYFVVASADDQLLDTIAMCEYLCEDPAGCKWKFHSAAIAVLQEPSSRL